MKKVGIITMHRVLNYGSSLQAYALYKKIIDLGYDCEIIDYIYPNEYHKTICSRKLSSKDKLIFLLNRIKFFILYRASIQKRRFSEFWKENVKLSITFKNQKEIYDNPPKYDIYLVGSDQVWNPNCMKGDAVFFCDFIKDKPKLSYASSFSISKIQEGYKELYKHYLYNFSDIGVREDAGVSLIKELVQKEAKLVCDPTLLLSKDDYIYLSKQSDIQFKEPYILVYALSYAYNPYPILDDVVYQIQKQLNIKVVYLHVNAIDHYHIGKSITSAGPNEFVRLFMDASFIVTSSFHGTAFALNFQKPFYAIIPNKLSSDSRIQSLLSRVGAEDRAVCIEDDDINKLDINMDYTKIQNNLDEFRKESILWLENVLNK